MKLAPVVDLGKEPLILTIQEMSRIYRLSPLTIRRQLQEGTFQPSPFGKYPYRWRRDDVDHHLKGSLPKLKTRRHGFAATKAKRLAAEARATK